MDSKLEGLFQPIQIGRIQSGNRIVMAPMNTNMAHGDGSASQRNRDYYAERAKGGAGIVILEALFIEWAAKHRTFGMGVSQDKYIPGLARVARGIQAHGGLAVPQINHNGRILSEDVSGLQTVAPSNFVNPLTNELSVELSTLECQELVEKYAQAARRIMEAGFDAVEVHGCHGYLLAQFLSPFTNQRQDQYGGSLEGRMRLPLEVVKRVKELCGPEFPVFYRVSGSEMFQGGLTLRDTSIFAAQLEKAGVDCLDVSGSSLEGLPKLAKVIPCNYYPHKYHVASAAALKKVVNIPVIGVGRINSPELAAEVINEGQADLVAVGRQFIADAHWPNKAKQGRSDEIIKCIACNIGCIDVLLVNRRHITCVANPTVGREGEELISPAPAAKKVAVVGAGPAGLEAARVAAMRGHQVSLFEKSAAIGGQLNLACQAPGKQEYKSLIDRYAVELDRLGVEVKLESEVTPALLEQLAPDAVVLASGGRPKLLEADWVGGENVADAWRVLEGSVTTGDKVVIVGGGRVGLECAEYLLEQGRDVVVIEAAPRIGSDLGVTVRPVLMNRLIRSTLNVFNKAQVLSVRGKEVTIDREGDIITVGEVDNIILSVGTEAENSLQGELEDKDFELIAVGDCQGAAGIMEAVSAGFEAGRAL